jgi:hypothetical protein
MRALSATAAAGTVLASSLLGIAASNAATDPAVYGDSIGVSFGAVHDALMPVTVDLPAPGDGVRVAQVTFSWQQRTPTYQMSYIYRTTVPTPDCVADQACRLETQLPTGRMTGGNIGVLASDGTTILGSKSMWAAAANQPRPTVVMTAPGNYSNGWGEVILAADATESTDGVPLKGVRFYLNPNGTEDQPYLFDDTAPYQVTVPATDIAPSPRTGVVTAVAEDVQGHLSWRDPMHTDTRNIKIGPPPVISWMTPAGDGRPAGDMASMTLLGWRAALPDTAPANPDSPAADPYIDRVEILMDGQQWADMPAGDYPIWARFAPDPRYREAEYTHGWTAQGGMTPGRHTATLRVTTSYGAVATAERTFLVTDGLEYGPLRADGTPVTDGQVFTGGTTHTLAYAVAGKVPGTTVDFADLSFEGGSLTGGPVCTAPDWWTCPTSAVVRGRWDVPEKAGTYLIEYSAQTFWQAAPELHQVSVTVQAATRLAIGATSTRVRDGRAVTLDGRLTRTATGKGIYGVAARLEWRKAGTGTWTTVSRTQTTNGGWVDARVRRHASGDYRWVSPGLKGTIAPAHSRTVRVTVTR